MEESRSIRQEIFVGASPEEVWRALTDPAWLVRWFPLEAEVTPGPGGSIWVSWGEGAEGRAPITAWEPGRRLGWTESYGPVRLAVDFHLEPAGGGTIVRLVHSGFGTGADWDDQYHMVEGGWQYFLRNLRHVLERHPGVPRDMVSMRAEVVLTREEAFARLTGPDGLAASGTLENIRTGDRVSIATASGDALEGDVILVHAPLQLALHVDNLNDAMLLLEIEPAGDGAVRPGLWLSTYGLPAERVSALRRSFAQMYRSALAV